MAAVAIDLLAGASKQRIRGLQAEANRWTHKYLRGVTPLRVDGVLGHHTFARVMGIKFYLGYGEHRDGKVTRPMLNRMRHPHSRKFSTLAMLRTAANRRRRQRNRSRRNDVHAVFTRGVGRLDGKPVALCLIPILLWCRANGWHGAVVSGWRDPMYSRGLCRNMCGADSCPGRCAGTASNHVGNSPARCAVDVSDYWNFRRIVARCPLAPRIFNALPVDPVHFSPSGR